MCNKHASKIKNLIFNIFFLSALSSIFSQEINVRNEQNAAVYVVQEVRLRVAVVVTS